MITLMVTKEVWSLTITFVDPPGGHPPPVPRPGDPAKPWLQSEKAVVEEALGEWNKVIRDHGRNWAVRWAGRNLFKNWDPRSCNFTTLLGVTGIKS